MFIADLFHLVHSFAVALLLNGDVHHVRRFDDDASCAIARTNRLLISIALHGRASPATVPRQPARSP
ncbi:hypothetical protein IQ229_06370 [Nostoc cf. edaphicum LEGE 07299]|uniref:Transposase n=1 Tax=Nostoc cf. edaphicum LEGE 07299 TaxID=2777974 RepID=A0ABR9TVY6_9NOSO|nr:hypothetical protein [Nostoc edaphicum]MBE9104573.1 hypothetical protein [Nostoc cf. edaphicum LEGE 07299]